MRINDAIGYDLSEVRDLRHLDPALDAGLREVTYRLADTVAFVGQSVLVVLLTAAILLVGTGLLRLVSRGCQQGWPLENLADNMAALAGQPRRKVIPHQQGYAVTGSDFVTSDPVLAEAVAREFDRCDPRLGIE